MLNRNLISFTIIAAAVACGKTKDAADDFRPVNGTGDDGSVQEVQVGQEFSFGGWLDQTDDGYRLTRHFHFTTSSDKKILLTQSHAANCDDGTSTLKENSVQIADEAGSIKLTNAEKEGFTLVKDGEFPGKLGANSYTMTATFAHDVDCWATTYFTLKDATDAKPVTKPEPKPEPKPEQKPEPKPAGIDAALAHGWKFEQAGFVTDLLAIGADGKGTEKITLQGETYVDIEFTVVTDTQANPDRMQMTVTKVIHAAADADVHVGDVSRCIYQASANAMKFECGEGDAYPTAFSSDATDYARQ